MERRIVSTTTPPSLILFSSSKPPCSANEVTVSSGDCVESTVEQFLENEALPGFRVWQLAGIVLSVLLTIIIALCCCIRFRVPRTKQEIEADYIRKRITKSFGKELTKINNKEMDDMDLKQAMDKIQATFDAETELQKQQGETTCEEPARGFRAGINAVLYSMNLRLAKNEPRELNGLV